jgi:lipoate-protein ligase B
MEVINLGEIPYSIAHQKQIQFRDEVIAGGAEKIITCSHPPVVTLGRQSTPMDITGWKGETVNIERGGKATYHGPGQLVVYPHIDLSKRNNDIHKYVRHLEDATVETLKRYGITAIGNPSKSADTTGVWVGEKKIASIGIAVKRWVTYHGIAINLFRDPLAFTGINPCGFSTDTMISLEELLGEKIDRQEFEKEFLTQLVDRISLK